MEAQHAYVAWHTLLFLLMSLVYYPKRKMPKATKKKNSAIKKKKHATASKKKASTKTTTTTNQGVYVLEHNKRFYVGKSTDITKRIKEHKAGRGTTCYPSLAKAKRVRPLTEPVHAGSDMDTESWERNETLTRIYEYGLDAVRGWIYTNRYLTQADKESAFHQVCDKFDLCRRCGGAGHFVSKCTASSRVPWAQRLL